MTIRRYFLDESGHSGDLALDLGALSFGGQPVFTLACLGIGDEAALLAELQRLRQTYRIRGTELKSSTLKSRLTSVGGELARFVVTRQWPVFIEVVEKRFFLAIHIVNHLLCGGMGVGDVDVHSRNLMAEYLSDHAPTQVFQPFVWACDRQTMDAVRASVDCLWAWTDSRDEETARLIQILTLYARDRAHSPSARAASFLPIPDVGPGGRNVWMLPNLQCLTNIYARINRYAGSSLGEAELVHDEQLQYGSVLEDAKAQMEDPALQAVVPFTPFADYRLKGQAGLSFARWTDEPSLQAADILAGFTMRFVRAALAGAGALDTEVREAFFDLLRSSDPLRATGVNFVMTMRDLARAGIPTVYPSC